MLVLRNVPHRKRHLLRGQRSRTEPRPERTAGAGEDFRGRAGWGAKRQGGVLSAGGWARCSQGKSHLTQTRVRSFSKYLQSFKKLMCTVFHICRNWPCFVFPQVSTCFSTILKHHATPTSVVRRPTVPVSPGHQDALRCGGDQGHGQRGLW